MATFHATVGLVAALTWLLSVRGAQALQEPMSLLQTQVDIDESHWHDVGQSMAKMLQQAAEVQLGLSGEEVGVVSQSPAVLKEVSSQSAPNVDRDFWLLLVIIIESTVLMFTIGIPFFVWLMAFVLGRVIKGAIETFDRLVIGTDVTIKDLRTNVFNGVVSIEGLEVHNPQGDNKYDSKYLLKAGIVHIDLDMVALFCSFFSHFKIEKMEFKNVDVIVEKGRGCSNVQDVINFLQGGKQGTQKERNEDKGKDKDDPPAKGRTQVTLHEVVVEDVGARVQAQMLGGRGMRMSVGDIKYKDFAEEVGESTVGPIVQVLLKSVLKTVAVNIVGKQIGEYLM